MAEGTFSYHLALRGFVNIKANVLYKCVGDIHISYLYQLAHPLTFQWSMTVLLFITSLQLSSLTPRLMPHLMPDLSFFLNECTPISNLRRKLYHLPAQPSTPEIR